MSLLQQTPITTSHGHSDVVLNAVKLENNQGIGTDPMNVLMQVVGKHAAECESHIETDLPQSCELQVEPTLEHVYAFLKDHSDQMTSERSVESRLLELDCFIGGDKVRDAFKFWHDMRSKDIQKFGKSALPDFSLIVDSNKIVLNSNWNLT